jgi:hypothetical protein
MRLSPLHRTRDNKRENAALFFTRPTEMQSINVNAGFSRAKLKKRGKAKFTMFGQNA